MSTQDVKGLLVLLVSFLTTSLAKTVASSEENLSSVVQGICFILTPLLLHMKWLQKSAAYFLPTH